MAQNGETLSNPMKQETRTDLPSFPMDFEPGFFERIRGCSFLRLDSESLVIEPHRRAVDINFARITNWKQKRGRLAIDCDDGNSFFLKLPGQPERFVVLWQKLLDEFKDFRDKSCLLSELENQERFNVLNECFKYSALPYVRAVSVLLRIAELEQLSDIHFEPLVDQVKITLRKSGKITFAAVLAAEDYRGLLARLKFLAGCLSHITDQAQEGAFKNGENGFDTRFSCFPTDLGERLSLRFIQPLLYTSLESLGWKAEVIEQWRRLLKQKSGLFIISGPVGSGKTTALYASLSEMANTRTGNQLRVVTIEDPVEARIPGICQSSLDSMKGMSLDCAFKHLLRQDPDIIALGEIRDRECLHEALQAGLSGHRVFATFHAGRGGETLARIRQMGIEEYLILQGLRGIIQVELIYDQEVAGGNGEIVYVPEARVGE